MTPFLDCRRRCQASRTRLLRPACDALRTQYCSKRAHCLSRTLVLLTRHHSRLCRSELRRKRKRRAFRVLRGERECFFTPRCEQIRIRSVKTLTLASPGRPVRGFFFVRRSAALCSAFAVKTEPPAAVWPGAHGHARFHGGYTPNPAEDVVGRLNIPLPRQHCGMGSRTFRALAHNLPAVAAKLTSFATFY